MKILLTGASGLLGNAYAEVAIRRGHSIFALSSHREPVAAGIEQSIRIDARELEQITELTLEIWPDVIVNCAAISSPADVDANPDLAEKINVALPRHLSQFRVSSLLIVCVCAPSADTLMEVPLLPLDAL